MTSLRIVNGSYKATTRTTRVGGDDDDDDARVFYRVLPRSFKSRVSYFCAF